MALPLNIVLTNDDGYNAPGILTLYGALVSAGFNVHIVAPAVNQSAQGSSLGGVAALTGQAAITQFSPGNYAVDGRPATAALVGINDLFAGSPPDLVISGTNRGDNAGQSENISGTVNGALQGLFEGVPAIAVSAGSAGGSYDAGFANAANFMVDFLNRLQDARAAGQPILPKGEALSINMPGSAVLAGVSVTTVTTESSASFPYAPTAPNMYAEGFVPTTAPSGSSTSEGSQFLANHITISPLDGNWGAGTTDRDALAVRLGGTLNPAATGRPLNILLLNEDGLNAPGIAATRNALLAKGYNVTVLAPSTDQSGVGSALFLSTITVTQFDATSYSANGTPASLVALGLDPKGLFNGARPDLVVVGADQGDAVGVENANHSATLGGAITALFNYGVPSIALTSASGSAADLATSGQFVASLIANLQATQGAASSILPSGVGLSINVPNGAQAGNFAFTTIDAGTDSNLSAAGDAGKAALVRGGPVMGLDPNSEGNAFNAGKITVSPIDGSFAAAGTTPYAALAQLVGTTYGTPARAPAALVFKVSEDAYQGDAQFVVTVNGLQVGGAQTATASHAAGLSQTVTVLDFFDTAITTVGIRYINDISNGAGADRNLYVDRLTLNGVAFEGEAASNGAGTQLATEAALTMNGALTFRIQGSGPMIVATGAGGRTVQLGIDATVVNGNGPDTVMAASGAVTVGAATGSLVVLDGGPALVSAGAGSTVVGGAGADTVGVRGTGILFFGGAGQNLFIGGSGASTVVAGAGSSTVLGGAGGGVFAGGRAGNNVIVAGQGATTIFGGGNGDVLFAQGPVGDVIVAGGGNETLQGAGSSGNNTYFAGTGSNLVGLGSGQDVVFAGTGASTVVGGTGRDIYAFSNGRAGGTQSIFGFKLGTDQVSLQGYAAGEATRALSGAVTQAAAGSQTTTLTLSDNTRISFQGASSLDCRVFG